MDSRFETPIIAKEIDAAFARTYEPTPGRRDGQQLPLHTSLLELNSVLLIVMGGLAALLTAAAFLISAH